MRAVNAKTGVVGGADFTGGKRDRWRLRLAPGPYAIGAAAIPFSGGKLVERLVAFAGLRSGESEQLKLKLKLKRKGRGARRQASVARRAAPPRVAEGFGDVDVDYPAIWVKEWEIESPDPDRGVLRKGISDMIITDLVARLDCEAVVVERARIAEVISEQRLQQLPGFDPATAVRQGRLVRDNASVTGTFTEAGGQITISATYVDRRTGRSQTVSVQGSGEALFDLVEQLGAKLAEVICQGTINQIAGTFDMRIDTGSVFTYAGNVTFTRSTPAIFGGATGTYGVSAGQYTVTASGRDVTGATGCQQSGSKQFALPAGSGSIDVYSNQPTNLEPYEYGFSVIAGGFADTMDITLHSCPPGAEDYEGHVWSNYPVGALDVGPSTTHISENGIDYAGSQSESGGGASLHQNWSFIGTSTPSGG